MNRYAWLNEHYKSPLKISELASRARMSVSTFHQHFRMITTMTPLQFQKWLRLNEARRLMLSGAVDVYLPDFKYISPETASRYSKAPDYPGVAVAALAEMMRQAGEAVFDERGIMQRGVILRHLVLPGHTGEAKKIIRYAYETYGDRIYLSIMNQYTPMPGIEEEYPELGRKLGREEYDEVVDYAIDLGVENGFIQEGETAEESFIPPFDESGVLKK